MWNLRDSQIELVAKTIDPFIKYSLFIWECEMGFGKTFAAVELWNEYKKTTGIKCCLIFATTKTNAVKKEIEEINNVWPDIKIHRILAGNSKVICNNPDIYVTTHAIMPKIKVMIPKMVVVDESQHFQGNPPHISAVAKNARPFIGDSPCLIMSGNPITESFSSWYNMLSISKNSPFTGYKNFYEWHKDYGYRGETILLGKIVNYWKCAEFGDGRDPFQNVDKFKIEFSDKIPCKDIYTAIRPFYISRSQKDAGISRKKNRIIVNIPPTKDIEAIARMLKQEHGVAFTPNGKTISREELISDKYGEDIITVFADAASGKSLQITGGAIIGKSLLTDEKKTIYFDSLKLDFCVEMAKSSPTIIFYRFIADGEALLKRFKQEHIISTNSPEEFALFPKGKVVFVAQIQSYSEGIRVHEAENIVFYSPIFSYNLFSQAQERATSKKYNHEINIYFLCTGALEKNIVKKNLNGKYVGKEYIGYSEIKFTGEQLSWIK